MISGSGIIRSQILRSVETSEFILTAMKEQTRSVMASTIETSMRACNERSGRDLNPRAVRHLTGTTEDFRPTHLLLQHPTVW